MSVRPLRPTDLVGLAAFRRQAGTSELTAHTWPHVEPDSGTVPYLTLASSAVTQRERVWVASKDSHLVGMAEARPRAGGLVWDVQRLLVVPGAEDLAVELLDRVVAAAGTHQTRRVFLQTPSGGRAHDVARRAGFERYSESTLHMLPRDFKASRTDGFEARPRLRVDEQALFQLFLAAVPAPVRTAEALTLEEWAGLHRGSRRWRPTLGGSRQQYVWELGTSLIGWAEVTFGQRSQFIELLIHPRYADAADRFVGYALALLSTKAPVYVAARDYQAGLGSALIAAGFREVAQHDLHVKMLAARVREPRLVPANVVGG